jgi:hypothetical protein
MERAMKILFTLRAGFRRKSGVDQNVTLQSRLAIDLDLLVA